MKPTSFLKNSTAFPQMIQSLESRRLMSLTPGLDLGAELPQAGGPPIDSGFSQIVHPFGFDHASPDSNEFGVGVPSTAVPGFTGQNAPFSGSFTDADSFSQQLAHAIAAGKPISITPSDAPAPAAMAMSTLYSSLPNSTVAEIDAANTRMETSAPLSTLISRIESAVTGTIVESQLAQATPPFSNMESTSKTPTGVAAKSLSAALSVIASPLSVSTTLPIPPTTTPTPPTWSMIHSLDQELNAARAFSTQLIGELSRDGATALAHLESATISVIESAESVVSTGGWRSLAIAGAAVAAVACVQSEVKWDREKSESVFSNLLIQPVTE